MEPLRDGLVLYHGSYTEVSSPDLSFCARYKDFGRGFYLTTSLEQARSFSLLSARKAAERGLAADGNAGVVSRFTVSDPDDLAVKAFPDADSEWLRCVAAHRRRGVFPEVVRDLAGYDVLVGKVANDQTNNTITIYLSDGYGPHESEAAIGLCIGLLLSERLKDQYCFRTRKALSRLSFEGSERVCR